MCYLYKGYDKCPYETIHNDEGCNLPNFTLCPEGDMMLRFTKRIDDPSGIVSKLVFEDAGAIAEAVVYKYNDRGVICFSVQSGCPVGCVFCGTGKTFIRDLTKEEMELQIETGLDLLGNCEKIQIMSMSMGEPLYNFDEIPIREYLDAGYYFFVSSVGLRHFNYSKIYALAEEYERFGFQISLHHFDNKTRKYLLGNHSNLLDISELISLANIYKTMCGRNMYFNYIATGLETCEDVKKIISIVKNAHITVSVLCNTTLKEGNTEPAKRLCAMILKENPEQDIKLFDPAGQDTIGGGCGQLIYVQERFKELKNHD